MACERFRKMISRELDGALESAETEDIERHLASCSACRAFRAACFEGLSIHRAMKEIAPPPSLLPSILAAVEAPVRGGWLGSSLRFVLSAAAAAVFVLGLWVGGLIHESYASSGSANHADVLELTYLDENPPGSFGDILTASNQGGADEQR